MVMILASASPRRRQLLEQLGCVFSVKESRAKESVAFCEPAQIVMQNARLKAQEVAGRSPKDAVVIGADTLVFAEKQALGKPSGAEEARRMLAFLSGKSHQVYTGIAIVKKGECWTDYAATTVKMGAICAEEIAAYVATGEPLDKAGAYAIQGRAAAFICGIEGSYSNVVGLPLFCLVNLCRKAGVFLPWMNAPSDL